MAAWSNCSRADHGTGLRLWPSIRQDEDFSLWETISLWVTTTIPWPSLSSFPVAPLLCPTFLFFWRVSLAMFPHWDVPTTLWLGTCCWHRAIPKLTRSAFHNEKLFQHCFSCQAWEVYFYGRVRITLVDSPISFCMQSAVSLGGVPVCILFPTSAKGTFTNP